MKKSVRFVLVGLLIALVITLVMIAITGSAYAERQVVLENGMLTVWAEVMKVNDIPKELADAELAFQLVTGQKKEGRINGKSKTVYSLEFRSILPYIMEHEEYKTKIVVYNKDADRDSNRWHITPGANKSTEPTINSMYTYVFLWMPVGLLLLGSVILALCETTWGGFAFLYILPFVGMLSGTFAGWEWGEKGGTSAGALIPLLVFLFTINPPSSITKDYGRRSVENFVFFGGTCAAVLAGLFAGIFAAKQNLQIVLHYSVLLLAIMVISFAIATLVVLVRKKPVEIAA